ncbi:MULTISPECIES: hypothetical protein [Cohnella]|jgi:hypothetical protein|uniref:hypothetical protein n=1 Tax=Cohnella TaxID=329857 RepID=UPI000E39EAB2|nr:hypothetical protein [Cohnella sp.]REK66464.1 MAG: hypothetical protein C6P35_07265 [Cohnella sp.]
MAELQSLIREWEGHYAELLQIARDQHRLLQQPDVDWDGFAELANQWDERRRLATEDGERLKSLVGAERFQELCREHIQSLAEQALEANRMSTEIIRQQFSSVGTELRQTRDQIKIMQSYYHIGKDPGISYYFDEKK